jgi:hypothetical protein
MVLTVCADASHHTHRDSKGHGGIFVNLGSGPVFARSYKLKMVTRSSTESELVALEEAMTYVVWMRKLLSELGFDQTSPTPVFQDNTSTMGIGKKGTAFKRNKHILGKFAYVKEQLDEKTAILQYVPTKFMIADLLTKPLSESLMKHHMNANSIKPMRKRL